MRFLKAGLLKGLKAVSDGLEGINQSLDSAAFVTNATDALRRSIANEKAWLSAALEIAEGNAEVEKFCAESDDNKELYARAVAFLPDAIFTQSDETNAHGATDLKHQEPDFSISIVHDDPNTVSDTVDRIASLRREREAHRNIIFDKLKNDPELESFFLDALISNGQVATARNFEIYSGDQHAAGLTYSVAQLAVPPAAKSRRARPMPTDRRRAAIASHALHLNVPHLVHFTQINNLSSILKKGICSVAQMENEEVQYSANDPLRLDLQKDGISLSVSFPNDKLFYRWRMENPSNEWVVMLIDPSVLWSIDSLFCYENAANTDVRRETIDERKTLRAFERMFAAPANGASRDDQGLETYDPTSVQAEVLVMERIPQEMILEIVFRSKTTMERYRSILGDILCSVSANGPGYFGARTYARRADSIH